MQRSLALNHIVICKAGQKLKTTYFLWGRETFEKLLQLKFQFMGGVEKR